MMQFYTPWAALLLPLPFIIRALFHKTEAPAIELLFPHVDRLKKAFPSLLTARKDHLFFILLSLSWLFLVLALMQPERVDSFQEINHKGYDLMLAVDISGSMQAVDFSSHKKTISRLDATKEVVGQFALDRQGDRLGLITFGEQAFLHVPFTLDTIALNQALQNTLPGMAGNATAIGDALALGIHSLQKQPEGSRVLILLTDGEDNASRIPPLEAAKKAKEYGIKIYTIGIGSNSPVPFPNGFGGYTQVLAPLDENLLKQIAEITGGQFFSAQNPDRLKAIYETINTLEKTDALTTLHLLREPLYRYPLLISMGFLLTAAFFAIRRGTSVYA